MVIDLAPASGSLTQTMLEARRRTMGRAADMRVGGTALSGSPIEGGDSPSAEGCEECPIRCLPLFEDFAEGELPAAVGLKVGQRRVPRESILLRAGDPRPQMLTILSGWAFRFMLLPDGRRQVLSILLPGDTVGLEALLHRPIRYSVQAASAVTCCVLDPERGAELMATNPEFQRRFLDLMWRERQAADEWLARTGCGNAEERIVSLLVEIYERLAARGLAEDRRFQLEMTQQQIADALGLHIIHLNRVLRRLRKEGLLHIVSHQVLLQDLPGLTRLVPLRSETEEVRPLL